eukprot:INCI4629.2.p1 GENE.INCI4629.2~~INCI4629.2.p1  ORF type:complete len:278 (+),score=46.62 INCI4629.2:92-925(+)
MVKEATKRNSPFAAVRRGSPSHSPRTLRRITGFRKEPQELSQPKNILTAFARCTVEKCLNKKQPGTPRCRWHNRWLYKVPADTMCAMFEHKLAGISSENDASNANISPQTALENQRICAAQSLEASQENLCNALKKEHLKHGVSFDWPDQKFVDKRIKELQTFVAAVAREIVQPTGFLDISDSFAIDAVVERMYMVGLMNPSSTFKTLESTHMKCLINFFKFYSLGGASKITRDGVLRFIQYMFSKKDRMVVDLLYAKQTHINTLLEMLNVPVEETP